MYRSLTKCTAVWNTLAVNMSIGHLKNDSEKAKAQRTRPWVSREATEK